MIVNTPLYASDEVKHWLRNRELGKRPVLGTASRLRAQLYSSVKCVRQWNPSSTVDDTHHGGIFNFDFSPDGSLLVAACERKSILLFDPLNGKHTHTKNDAHSDCVNCVRFLDSRTFATCSDDTTVCLWDARFLKYKVRTFRGHSNWVKNIEYAQQEGLLVTSGFDGSIYTWAINSYSESDVQFTPVFHTEGLMRSKLTPDASKLIIATTGGYLMVVHDLNLNTLSDDLNGFKPNRYRLMQTSKTPVRTAYSFNHLFSRKRNRVELISDFYAENEAEMITSLEVHPQGWCVVSRNTSKEEGSEWTCVHDIQSGHWCDEDATCSSTDSMTSQQTEDAHELTTSSDTVSDATNDTRQTASSDDESQAGDDESQVRADPFAQLAAFDWSSTIQSALERVRSEFPELDVALNVRNTSAEAGNRDAANASTSYRTPAHIQFSLRLTGRPSTNRRGDRANTSENERSGVPSIPNQSTSSVPSNTNSGQSSSTGLSPYMVVRNGGNLSERTLIFAKNMKHDPNIKIQQNKRRMTHFLAEANVGRGFIKEVCFSNDGRLICSPFGYGIRLLAFDPLCNELCDCVPTEPMRLYEVTSNMSHSVEVVTTKFSPTHPLIVSGCLNGKVDFHQPLL